MLKGIIRRLIDGSYGFIKTEQEEDLFFHRNDLDGVNYESLREGQEVELEKGEGRGGRTQATKVRLAETQEADDGADDQVEADDGEDDKVADDQVEDDKVADDEDGGDAEG